MTSGRWRSRDVEAGLRVHANNAHERVLVLTLISLSEKQNSSLRNRTSVETCESLKVAAFRKALRGLHLWRPVSGT